MKTNALGTRRQTLTLLTSMLGSGFLVSKAADHGEEGVSIVPLFNQELAGHPEEQVSMTVVTYAPGKSSPPHRHHGPVFVYVIEGNVELQITGGPLTTVKAGETFYEPPGSIHEVSRNASKTEPAKLIAFIVGKTGTAVTSPVKE
ncbi:MAG: cupin domain-containing protein [Verrucomicrobiota bacterium]